MELLILMQNNHWRMRKMLDCIMMSIISHVWGRYQLLNRLMISWTISEHFLGYIGWILSIILHQDVSGETQRITVTFCNSWLTLSRQEDILREYMLTGILGRVYSEVRIIVRLESKGYLYGILIMTIQNHFLISSLLEVGLNQILNSIRVLLLYVV